MPPLLRIELDVFNVEVGMLNAAFEQRPMTIVGAEGQCDFEFGHDAEDYRKAQRPSTAMGTAAPDIDVMIRRKEVEWQLKNWTVKIELEKHKAGCSVRPYVTNK